MKVGVPLGLHAAELCPHKLRVRPPEATDTTNPKDAIASRKPASFSVVPTVSLQTEAQAMEWGAFKAGDKGTGYGPFNWRQTPVRLSVYLDAMMRHFIAYIDGEEAATDSKVHHLGHLKAGCGIILDAAKHGTLIDDRPFPRTGNTAAKETPEFRNQYMGTFPDETTSEREIAKAQRRHGRLTCFFGGGIEGEPMCSRPVEIYGDHGYGYCMEHAARTEPPAVTSSYDGVAKELDRHPRLRWDAVKRRKQWEDIKRSAATWPCPYCSSEMIEEDAYAQHLKHAHKKTVCS